MNREHLHFLLQFIAVFSIFSTEVFADNTPVKPPLSTHILDISEGKPAANVSLSLYEQQYGEWKLVKQSFTKNDGRCADLTSSSSKLNGIYKLRFETGPYFAQKKMSTFFPFIEVAFEVLSPNEHYHVPLLLSAHGYSTYRGS